MNQCLHTPSLTLPLSEATFNDTIRIRATAGMAELFAGITSSA